jgi:hypothetical protein
MYVAMDMRRRLHAKGDGLRYVLLKYTKQPSFSIANMKTIGLEDVDQLSEE